MKQSRGVRLLFQVLYFVLGISVLIRIYGSWVPQKNLADTLQLVLFSLVVVALLVSIIMEAIGLGNWAWVIFLLLLPVVLANVIGLHVADYLGVLNVQDSNFVDYFGVLEARDRPFIMAYFILFSNLIILITFWHHRENLWESDDLGNPHEENQRRQ
ncbi:MAG: hypothetical protein DWQ07_06655 [Chloroflexi bacterium]|nr:MAG: hypothetical protein DWQ07_06655 [Chloroflexota bacterium]MBL1195889.1 hypothetical protein [Chloroflexota bacterium]NOH13182.1 hypothetical protein [Chloroflexota bacterium]